MKKGFLKGNGPACLMLALLALGSLFVGWDALLTDGSFPTPLVPPGSARFFLAALTIVAFSFLFKKKSSLTRVSLWLPAAVFAAVMTLAQSFAAVGTTAPLTQSLHNLLKAALYFIGRTALYYACMAVLLGALARGTGGAAHAVDIPRMEPTWGTIKKKRMKPLWTIGFILLCWLPYFLCIFPGVVSNDSISQLREILGIMPLSNANPVFQTFLWAVFVRIGQWLGNPDAGVALYCCLQALLMAVVFNLTLRVIEESGSPSWLWWVSMLFFALCPVFPLFAFCVGKDTNFATAVLFFTLTVWRFLRLPSSSKTPWPLTATLALSAALLLLLRNPGSYLAACTLILLLTWTLSKKQRRSTPCRWICPAVALAITACLYIVLHLVVLPGLQALPMPETENYSLPLQQTARVVASQPETLTPEEKEIIECVLDFDAIKPAYNGELSDPIKLLWKEEATPAQKGAFFRTWLSFLGKYPFTCFSATFHNSYGYLCPGYLSTIKPTLLIGNQGRTTDTEGFFPFSVNSASVGLKAAMDRLANSPLFRWIISPGLYGWIVLFTLAMLLASHRKNLLLAAVPALFSLAGCMLSAVNSYFRYAMPLYFSAPLLLALCAQALSHPGIQEERC